MNNEIACLPPSPSLLLCFFAFSPPPPPSSLQFQLNSTYIFEQFWQISAIDMIWEFGVEARLKCVCVCGIHSTKAVYFTSLPEIEWKQNWNLFETKGFWANTKLDLRAQWQRSREREKKIPTNCKQMTSSPPPSSPPSKFFSLAFRLACTHITCQSL